MGYNFDNARNGKKHVENIKMAKFEAPGIKKLVFMTIWIFKKLKRFVWKKLLESMTLLSSNSFHWYPLNFQNIETVV